MDKKHIETIHFIGNAHIDPVWLWRWPEGYQETRATFRSALDRMKEFPDFIFTASQAAVYQWIEESDPEMFEEIKQRVYEGRWAVVNGWWMEPDCNIPSGESFARQSLYGQSYFKEKFGQNCLSGYCVDSFGHHAMLPQLLVQGGFKYYVFMRPGKVENPECPDGPFWWESSDGSRILAYRLLSGYGTGPDGMTPEAVRKIAGHFDETVKDEMFFYGVGDHGGGPTIQNIRSILEMQKDATLPRLIFSSPDQYFESLTASETSSKLPVFKGELQMHAVGCYAVQSGIKAWNRKAENDLLQSERWSAISNILQGTPYPGQELTKAWQAVLFNQFHDILAGSSIHEAYDDARDAFGSVFQVAAAATNKALQRISGKIDTRGGDTAIVVFNPSSVPLKVPVEHELMTWHLGGRPLDLIDDNGKEVTWQPGPLSAAVPPGWRMRVCFIADLPPMGYRTYFLNAVEAQKEQKEEINVESLPVDVVNGYDVQADGRQDLAVENDTFQLVFDARLGDIKQWVNKKTGENVFNGHAAFGLVLDDPSDTWSHGMTAYRTECGRFSDARVKVVETGPERVVVRSTTAFGKSTLTQDFIIYKGLPWVEVRAAVDWHEHLKLLKLSFPMAIDQPEATFEIPYGVLERPVNGREVPGQRWLDVTGKTSHGTMGVSLINNNKYSFDVKDSEVRMTILRSPVYAHHTPKKLDGDNDYVFMDQGKQEFSYLLLPHIGAWKAAETIHLAEYLNMPAVSLTEGIHDGTLPRQQAFLNMTGSNVVVGAFKIAESGDDVILRLREGKGESGAVKIEIPILHREMSIDLKPWQIKTLRIPRNPDRPVQESNFLEE